MKVKLLLAAFIVAVIGLGACGGGDDDPKSNACDITSFTDGGKAWQITGTTITGSYAKTEKDKLNSISPTIEVSKDATVSPATGVTQDFSNGKTVTYIVTAADATTKKTYTAQATATATQ